MRTLLAVAALLAGTAPLLAGPTCSPGDPSAQILASARIGDVHPAFSHKRVAYRWSLQVKREDHDDAGMTYYVGDLYDAQGKLSTKNVFVLENEWDCGP